MNLNRLSKVYSFASRLAISDESVTLLRHNLTPERCESFTYNMKVTQSLTEMYNRLTLDAFHTLICM